MYSFLADLLVGIHLGYVVFVVVGQLLIWIGWAWGWKWIRNRTFRVLHLLAMAIVAFEQAMSLRCPLSVWEQDLRMMAGEKGTSETFLGRLFQSVLFYELPTETFAWIYYSMTVLIVATLILCPPQFRRKPREVASC